MIQKVRKILMGFLVLTLCVPMNTVFAEGTNGHSKEVQSISLQEDSQKEEKSENENLQVPTESVTGENIDDSGNVDFPQEPEVPSSEWTSGWNFYEGNWYYAKEENTLYFGWIYLNSKWYYLDGENAGIMACNEMKKIGDSYYAFDGSGAMQTGWVLRPEGWYYADNSGACAIGWRYIRGVWYYLDGADTEHPGLMADNCTRNIGGSNFYFAAGGAMQTGWVLRPEGWYYADGNGSGAMATNWLALNGEWYWFSGDGAMKTGWQVAGGVWYYMYTKNDTHGGSEGVMAKNTVIDGFVVHENGAYIRAKNKLGWQNPAGYPQVSSLTVMLPSYCTGYFTYVTPSRISIYASRQECVDAFIARAYEYLGTRYIEPWSSYPGDAVDCSGFVLQCLYATGMDLGIYNPYNHRWIASQTYNSMNWYNNNTFMPVSTNSLQRGDLVYYRGHVAIYLGNGQIIDSWPGQGVSVKPIGSRGRVIGAARPYV